MSEKKPVRAIDEFMPDGSFVRTLVFENSEGKIESIPFPHDSMVVMRSPTELYDWYGRKVELSDNIDHVIRRDGSVFNGDLTAQAKETFIVQKTNGKLTIGRLDVDEPYDPENQISLPWFKQVRTGMYMNHKPVISAREHEFTTIDNSIFETPIMQAFFENTPKYFKKDDLDFLTEVNIEGSPGYYWSVIRNRKFQEIGNGWIFHDFVNSRKTIMDTPEGKEPSHGYANYVLGDIEILDGGNKLSALCPLRHENGPRRIFTDIEVVRHMRGRTSLWWYYK